LSHTDHPRKVGLGLASELADAVHDVPKPKIHAVDRLIEAVRSFLRSSFHAIDHSKPLQACFSHICIFHSATLVTGCDKFECHLPQVSAAWWLFRLVVLSVMRGPRCHEHGLGVNSSVHLGPRQSLEG
jgi:hypothetical protein